MAMTILNNSAANMTLGELNKNIQKVGKSLSKVASGQKLNSAGDNASAYGISETMRVQIRGLEQDIQNVQNGSAMLRTALGGIENIVDEIRNLRELAIDSANDSNSDADRATLQKVFDQKKANIEDIATTIQYNGKRLLDGSVANAITSNGGLTKLIDMTKAFSPGAPNTQPINNPEKTYYQYPTTQGIEPQAGFRTNFQTWANSPVAGIYWPDGTPAYDEYSFSYSGGGLNHIGVRMDFSGSGVSGSSLRNFLNGKGFSILCGQCPQYINIKFDSSTSESTVDRDVNVVSTTQINYTIGVAKVNKISDLNAAIYDGIKNSTYDEIKNQYVTKGATTNSEIVRVDRHHALNIVKENGKYYLTKEPGFDFYVYNGLVGDADTEPTNPTPIVTDEYEFKPLWIQHGTKANQRIHVYINSMRLNALELEDTDISTKDNAISALEDVDNALTYALGEATTVGAYLERLEYMESNIVTSDENTQGAESTIRDADMAKEMTEYTKNNVLSQAAQSMLAQANQNMSSVLSLLQ